jgi:hypothetical protein
VKVCTPVHGLCVSSIAKKKKKVRVLEYTFSLLPLSLVRFGFCTNLVRFRFSSLNKVVERTGRVRGLESKVEA